MLPICREEIPKSNLSNLATERTKDAVHERLNPEYDTVYLYPTLEVACVPASVEAAERVARAVDVGLAHAPAVGLHAVARGQVRQAVHRRAAPTGHVVVVIVGKSDGEEYLSVGTIYGGCSSS